MARAKQQRPLLPSLEAGPVPLHAIRDSARKQLIDLIDSKRGKKALVLDPSISGALSLLDAGLSELLTEHGVVKLLYLERKRLDDPAYNSGEPRVGDVRSVAYIARATLENAQLIAWQVKASSGGGSGSGAAAGGVAPRPGASSPQPAGSSGAAGGAAGGGGRHEFSVFWVPRRSVACERLLEEEGVYGDVVQGELGLDMVPLEEDVLSLELPSAMRECSLEGDPAALFYTAAAIMRLQHLYGLIPHIQGKGRAAVAVRDIYTKMRREMPPPAGGSAPGAGGAGIDRLILVDRELDVVTPLVTQITFEGLIDEVVGIRPGGAVTWTPSGGGSGGGRGGGSALLNSSDPFFKEFRDLPYYLTSARLQQYARDARREYESLGSKDLGQLKTFVKGLPKLLLLERLSDIAAPVAEVVKHQGFHDRLAAELDMVENADPEESVKFIQEQIWRGSELASVLRLLLLLSATNGGIPKKHYDMLRGEVLAAFGHQHLLTLIGLEKAGLLRVHTSGRGSWPIARKALRLVCHDDAQQMDNPSDVAHLHRGYAPLTIRLVEAALAPSGWGAPSLAEAMAALPGGVFDGLQVRELGGTVVDAPAGLPGGGGGGGGGGAAVLAGASAGGKPGGSISGVSGGSSGAGTSDGPETVLVVFVGGCTFSEVSALRWLQERAGSRARFLVLTTSIINGRSLVESFVDPVVTQFLGSPAAAALV